MLLTAYWTATSFWDNGARTGRMQTPFIFIHFTAFSINVQKALILHIDHFWLGYIDLAGSWIINVTAKQICVTIGLIENTICSTHL